MKTNPTLQTTESKTILMKGDSPAHFVALLGKIETTLQEAADMLARLVAKDPAALDTVRRLYPAAPLAFLQRLLRVGQRRLHPELMLNSCVAFQRLENMPYEQQERLLARPTVALIDEETGKVVQRPLVNLTPMEANQAFARLGPRTLGEQREWLKARKIAAQAVPAPTVKQMIRADFTIRGGKLVVTQAGEIPLNELLALVAQAAA